MFLGNAMVMKEPMWGQRRGEREELNVLDKEKDAEKYEQSVLDRHSAVVISLLVDIGQEIPEDSTMISDLLEPEDRKFLSGYDEYERNKDRPWDAKIASSREDVKVLIMEVKDTENVFA